MHHILNMFEGQGQGQGQPWERKQMDDGQMDRRYKVHYLPRFGIDNNILQRNDIGICIIKNFHLSFPYGAVWK